MALVGGGLSGARPAPLDRRVLGLGGGSARDVEYVQPRYPYVAPAEQRIHVHLSIHRSWHRVMHACNNSPIDSQLTSPFNYDNVVSYVHMPSRALNAGAKRN